MSSPIPLLDRTTRAALACVHRMREHLSAEVAARVAAQDGASGPVFPTFARGRSWQLEANDNWFTGFWPGLQWLAAAAHQTDDASDPAQAAAARAHASSLLASFSARLDAAAGTGGDLDHDIGFLYTLTARAQWQITGDRSARAVAIRAAFALARRFRERGRYLQAWGPIGDAAEGGRAIIDSVMNLPLLWWAAAEVEAERADAGDGADGRPEGAVAMDVEIGPAALREIALAHAETCLSHLVRPDGATYHTFVFDQATGEPIGPRTDQGCADDSLWARGQAWAIYGFAVAAAWTGQERFVAAAERVADRFVAELPPGELPTWDLRLPPSVPAHLDSSAAAIAAGGLLRLARAVGGERAVRRRGEAERLIAALIEVCLDPAVAGDSGDCGEPAVGLLRHGNYDTPRGLGLDGYLIFGDYFFLETLLALADRAPDFWGPTADQARVLQQA